MRIALNKAYPRLISTKSCVRINSIPAQEAHQEASKASKVLTKSNHFIRHFELFCYYSPKKRKKTPSKSLQRTIWKKLHPCHGARAQHRDSAHTRKSTSLSKSFVLEGTSHGHTIPAMLDPFPVYLQYLEWSWWKKVFLLFLPQIDLILKSVKFPYHWAWTFQAAVSAKCFWIFSFQDTPTKASPDMKSPSEIHRFGDLGLFFHLLVLIILSIWINKNCLQLSSEFLFSHYFHTYCSLDIFNVSASEQITQSSCLRPGHTPVKRN